MKDARCYRNEPSIAFENYCCRLIPALCNDNHEYAACYNRNADFS